MKPSIHFLVTFLVLLMFPFTKYGHIPIPIPISILIEETPLSTANSIVAKSIYNSMTKSEREWAAITREYRTLFKQNRTNFRLGDEVLRLDSKMNKIDRDIRSTRNLIYGQSQCVRSLFFFKNQELDDIDEKLAVESEYIDNQTQNTSANLLVNLKDSYGSGLKNYVKSMIAKAEVSSILESIHYELKEINRRYWLRDFAKSVAFGNRKCKNFKLP